MFADVAPGWPRVKRWYFKSQHHQDLHQSVNNESANTESAADGTCFYTTKIEAGNF